MLSDEDAVLKVADDNRSKSGEKKEAAEMLHNICV